MPKFRLIDLFAGIGGMTCGFTQTERFEPVFAVELEPAAAKIYETNFGPHIHVGDIADVENFPVADVIIGGPPCQGFSPLGRDRDDTSRAALNSLWQHFVRALEEVRPRVFVMENVPELLKSAEYASFKKLVEAEPLGYQLREQILNAADFGVPQLRRRAIIIGVPNGTPPWPAPTHDRDSYVTVREALRGLPLEPDEHSWHRGRPNIRPTSLERYEAVPEGGNRFDLARNRPDLLPRCWRESPPVRQTSLVGFGGIDRRPRFAPSSTSRKRAATCTPRQIVRSPCARPLACKPSRVDRPLLQRASSSQKTFL